MSSKIRLNSSQYPVRPVHSFPSNFERYHVSADVSNFPHPAEPPDASAENINVLYSSVFYCFLEILVDYNLELYLP